MKYTTYIQSKIEELQQFAAESHALMSLSQQIIETQDKPQNNNNNNSNNHNNNNKQHCNDIPQIKQDTQEWNPKVLFEICFICVWLAVFTVKGTNYKPKKKNTKKNKKTQLFFKCKKEVTTLMGLVAIYGKDTIEQWRQIALALNPFREWQECRDKYNEILSGIQKETGIQIGRGGEGGGSGGSHSKPLSPAENMDVDSVKDDDCEFVIEPSAPPMPGNENENQNKNENDIENVNNHNKNDSISFEMNDPIEYFNETNQTWDHGLVMGVENQQVFVQCEKNDEIVVSPKQKVEFCCFFFCVCVCLFALFFCLFPFFFIYFESDELLCFVLEIKK